MSSARRTPPLWNVRALVMEFFSSRTLPGQSYSSSLVMAAKKSADVVIVADTRKLDGILYWWAEMYNESHFFFAILTMRAAAPSLLQRVAGYNPFVLAAWGGAFALLAGLVPLYLGCRYIRLLASLGCGEVVRVLRETPGKAGEQTFRIWCQLYGLRAPALGTACAVYDGQGRHLCNARAAESRKGSLELTFSIVDSPAANAGTPPKAVRTGCLVQLRPHQQPHSPPATGS